MSRRPFSICQRNSLTGKRPSTGAKSQVSFPPEDQGKLAQAQRNWNPSIWWGTLFPPGPRRRPDAQITRVFNTVQTRNPVHGYSEPSFSWEDAYLFERNLHCKYIKLSQLKNTFIKMEFSDLNVPGDKFLSISPNFNSELVLFFLLMNENDLFNRRRPPIKIVSKSF